MNLHKILLLAFFPFLLTACTSIQTLSAKDQQQIHTLSLNKEGTDPKEMVLIDPSVSFVGPLIGGIADAVAVKKLQASAEKNGYSPGQIMLTELKQAIQTDTKFKLTDNQKSADAIIKLKIRAYGFAVPHGFAMSMSPFLSVEASMYRNNLRVWHFENYQGITDVARVTTDQLQKDPKAMYFAWDAAARSLAKKMTASMKG